MVLHYILFWKSKKADCFIQLLGTVYVSYIDSPFYPVYNFQTILLHNKGVFNYIYFNRNKHILKR